MYLNKIISIRLRKDEDKDIKEILKKTKEKYGNYSHFIRSAIIKQIRKEKNELL